MQMDVEELEGGVTRIRLNGNLDIDGADQIGLSFAAVTGARRKVVVDLAEVRYLASMGVRCLLSGAKTVKRRGGRMLLLDPTEPVRQVLQACGIDGVVPIVDGWDKALAAVQ